APATRVLARLRATDANALELGQLRPFFGIGRGQDETRVEPVLARALRDRCAHDELGTRAALAEVERVRGRPARAGDLVLEEELRARFGRGSVERHDHGLVELVLLGVARGGAARGAIFEARERAIGGLERALERRELVREAPVLRELERVERAARL